MHSSTSQPERSTKAQIKKRQAQKRLLDQGLELMANRGLSECKVEEITKAAGVAKGSFFNYFGSKESFVVCLVDHILSDLARRVLPLKLAPTDAESLVSGVGAVHLRYFQLRPSSAAILNQAVALASNKEVGATIRERLTQHLDLMADMLRPACGALDWPSDRVRELALMMLSNSIGFFWLGQAVGVGDETPVNLLDRLAKVQARGLSAKI